MVLPLGVYRKVGDQVAFLPNTVVTLVCLVRALPHWAAPWQGHIRAARA
jgi:hypothetical protein